MALVSIDGVDINEEMDQRVNDLPTTATGEQLTRRIGPILLTLYGVGVMVGAGIYVLVGAVAGRAGVYAPLAFVAAGAIAAPTAFSYAELSTRVPESAGEAAFVRRAFGSRWLSLLIGLAVVGVGVTSAAAVLRGGAGYLLTFTSINENALVVLAGLMLVTVALWGALESLAVAAVFTVLEVCGLLVVVQAGLTGPAATDWQNAGGTDFPVSGLALAAVLAFFAFIGFEDMVNMVEEVQRPARTMPRAIIASLIITSLLYVLVSLATVRSVQIDALADSNRPLALVYETATGNNPRFLSAIAVVAALNGVLAQIVMAARVLFGLGRTHQQLAIFHRAHHRLGTPVLATGLIGTTVIAGALTLNLEALAETTSTFLLLVFCIVNGALLALKRREPAPGFSVGTWVPILGLVGSVIALVVSLVE